MSIKFFREVFFVFCLAFSYGCGGKKRPDLAANYYKLSLLELEERENTTQAAKKALCYLDEAIKLSDKEEYLALKATILFRLQKLEEACLFFQKAINSNLNPKLKSEVLNNYACLLAQLGNEELAFSVWKNLEQSKDYLTPEVALFNQSKLFLARSDYLSAKEKLLKAIKLSPNYLDAHFYLAAIASYFLKDKGLATRELEAVLLLDPGHSGAVEIKRLLDLGKIRNF